MRRLRQIGFFALVALALAGCGTTTTQPLTTQSPAQVAASKLRQWNEQYAVTFTSDAEAITADQDQFQTDGADGYNAIQWTSDCQQSQTAIRSMQSVRRFQIQPLQATSPLDFLILPLPLKTA